MKILKSKKFWISILVVIVVFFLSVSAFAGNFLVTYALQVDENGRIGSMGDEAYTGKQDTKGQEIYDTWVTSQDIEEWNLTSDDGLNLYAQMYKGDKDSHIYVLAVHGYTVDHRDIAPAIVPFVEKGWHVLTPDQRGRGKSEGSFVSMGWKEKDDVVKWAEKIVEYDPKAEIVLYGESMGAATVMMASGEKMPVQVKAMVEDCGYTSAYAMFKDQLKERFSLPEFPFLPSANIIGNIRYGFSFSQANAKKQLKKATLPILFIHGGSDDYVPTYMGKELYDSYKGEKELLIVEGAGHGASTDVDPERYYETVFTFLKKQGIE